MRPVPACVFPFLSQVEGDSKTSYLDSTGHWTIGRGHTGLAIGPGLVIDQATDDGYLHSDADRFALIVCSEVNDDQVVGALTDDEYGALISFAFNLGTLGPSIPKLLRAGKLTAVPPVMLRYDHGVVNGKMVEIDGLKNRRTAEVALWNTGDVDTAATIAQATPQVSSSVTRAIPTPPSPSPTSKPMAAHKTIWAGLTMAAGGLIGVANQVKDTATPLADAAPLIAEAAKYASVVVFVAALAVMAFKYFDEQEQRT